MLKNLRMRTKLIGGFMIIAFIAGVIGTSGILNIRKMASADRALYAENTVPLPIFGDLAVTLQKIRVALRDNLASKTPEQHQKYETLVEDLSSQLTKGIENFDQSTLSVKQKNIYGDLSASLKTYMGYRTRVVDFAKAGKPDKGWDLLWNPDYLKVAGDVQGALDKLMEMGVSDGKKIWRRTPR